MNDDIDIEEILKRYGSGPGHRVKRSVLERFVHTYGGRDAAGGPIGIWRRPVPVYLTAAVVIIVAVVSFFAGRRSLGPPPRSAGIPAPVEETEELVSNELKWEIARSDLF